MKQWVTNQNGLDKLRLVDVLEPSELKKGEVLVKINSVSLNFRDTEVVKVGPGASDSGIKEGDRVASIFNQNHLTGQIVEKDMVSNLDPDRRVSGTRVALARDLLLLRPAWELPLNGCLTQYRVLPAHGFVKVPQYLTDEGAACLPIATVTAWMAINTFQPIGQPVQGKDKVLLLQGTGGVAIAGLQIAKVLGLTTIITSSSDAKLERAKQLGADHTINYKQEPQWDEVVLKLTNGRGADIIFECGGAQTLGKSFRCVAFGGLISAIGYLSGKEDAAGDRINANVLALNRNVTFKGILVGPKDRFEEVLRWYEKGQIQPVIDRTFEFEKADGILQYLFSSGHFGKVVIKV